MCVFVVVVVVFLLLLFLFLCFSWPVSYALKKDKVPLCDRIITFLYYNKEKLTENKIHTVYFFLIRVLFKGLVLFLLILL